MTATRESRRALITGEYAREVRWVAGWALAVGLLSHDAKIGRTAFAWLKRKHALPMRKPVNSTSEDK